MPVFGRLLTLVVVVVALYSSAVSANIFSDMSCPSVAPPFNAFTCSSIPSGNPAPNNVFTTTCTSKASPSSVFTCSGMGVMGDNGWTSTCTLPTHTITCVGSYNYTSIYTTTCTSSGSPSTFTCTGTTTGTNSNYNFLSTSECESATSANTCNSNSNCTWCTSAAVGNSCVSKDDAASLPTSIFTCGAKKVVSEQAPFVLKNKHFGQYMGDAQYSRKYPQPVSNQTSVGTSKTLGATAASYPSDPFGYSSLYLAEFAYCGDPMNIDYSSNSYVSDFVPTQAFSAESGTIVGFVGYQPSVQAIWVSFRGTEDLSNWLTDLDVIRTTYPLCSGCSAHEGFYSAEQAALPSISSAVQALYNQYPGYSIVVTGHSLGGALATLCALDLSTSYAANQIYLYNYGSPRIFNQAGADWASSNAGINIGARRTHYQDIVPHVPPEFLGFHHISGEIYENGPSSNWPNFPGGTLQDCSGEEDPNCADQFDGTSVADHLLYSGVVMGSGGCP